MAEFRWNDWNRDHATRHGVAISEIEALVANARTPYPKPLGDDKLVVHGRGSGGRLIQVIFIYSPEKVIYVIHARPLNPGNETRSFRRGQR